MTRLPHFVVLGQGKAGTSFVYRVLSQNPAIGLSHPKELHYFSGNRDKGVDWYTSHFAHIAPETPMIGEVSPSYLRRDAIEALANTLGTDTKIIFLLRRPIERAYSRYLQNICATQQGPAFKRMARNLGNSLDQTIDAISACYDTFGANNVLPLMYETDIAEHPEQCEAKILAFLGLEQASHTEQVLAEGHTNPGVMPRYIYSGDETLWLGGSLGAYIVPPEQLVFCAQTRNTDVIANPSADQVRRAFLRQSHWSASVSLNEYHMYQRQFVLGAATKLETTFGFDMQVWRNPPQRIIYEPAPPPAAFLRGAS